MRERKSRSFNPLILDPEDYELLGEDEFLGLDDLEEGDPQYEHLSYGSRRKKPQINSDY